MSAIKIRYPVQTLDGRCLLPAGALVTADTLKELVSSRPEAARKEIPFMSYGTVREDLARFALRGPYRVIFADPGRNEPVWRAMERASLPAPTLEPLDYFRQRDPYTYQHILIVFALTTLLARELLEGDEALLKGVMAWPVHDIGKTCVPLRVLKKTSPLTRSERMAVEHHVGAGSVLLSYYLRDPGALAARVALEHHERRDGSGYPRGIPLSDRLVEIIAVCDAYDALISSRPYRPASFENRAALEELTEMARKGAFDEPIVQALIALNRRNKPPPAECRVSREKRGQPPGGNLYGVVVDDGDVTAEQRNDP